MTSRLIVGLSRRSLVVKPNSYKSIHDSGLGLDARAEPHLTSGQKSDDEEDWFQTHSTQVFLIFGSVLFVIILICIYALSRGTQKRFLPSCLNGRLGKNKSKIKAKRRNRKSRNTIDNTNVLNSITSSTNGLLGGNNRLSSYSIPSPGYGYDQKYGYGYGYDPRVNGYGGPVGDMNAGKFWHGVHDLPHPAENGGKQLWRKTAYLTDLKRVTEENSRINNLRRGNNHDVGDGGFPEGWEKITRGTLYHNDHGAQSPVGGGGGGHKRNTTISSFGHQPHLSNSSFYDSHNPYQDFPSSSPSQYQSGNRNGSSYSVYDQSNLNRPISNYIPYTYSPPHQGEEGNLTYPPQAKPPLTEYKKPFVSYMSNDPNYIEDIKSQGRRKSQSQSRTSTYQYPRSPASTYVPPKNGNRNSGYSDHSYDTNTPLSNIGYREGQLINQYNQHQNQNNQSPDDYFSGNHHHQYDNHQNDQLNQGYNDNSNYQNYPSQPYDQNQQAPNYSQKNHDEGFELSPNPLPVYSTGQNQELSPYTQLQPANDISPYTELRPATTQSRRGHERSPSIGSIKFPKPLPSPAPYTRSSTYSSQQQSPVLNFRSSIQPSIGSSRTFDTYGYPLKDDQSFLNEDKDLFSIRNEDDVDGDGLDDVDDPYSPSITEVNTKLNSGNIYSPSLYSKSRLSSSNNRKSYIPKLSNMISEGQVDKGDQDIDGEDQGPRRVKRNSSGPSLSQSSNPNPSPNFPPPPMSFSPSPTSSPRSSSSTSNSTPNSNLKIDTSTSTLQSNHGLTPNPTSKSDTEITSRTGEGLGGGSSEDHSSSSHSSSSSATPTKTKKISRIKPPSLLKSPLPPKSPSPLRYSSTFDMDDMPAWMIEDSNPPLPISRS